MKKLEIKNRKIILNLEAATISALYLGKIDKYEYHAGDEILPSDQS